MEEDRATLRKWVESIRNSNITLFDTYPGSGKTHFLINEMFIKRNAHVCYLSPRHPLTLEAIQTFENLSTGASLEKEEEWNNTIQDYEYFEGKSYKRADGSYPCEDFDGRSILLKYGRNDYYCKKLCPLRNPKYNPQRKMCEYKRKLIRIFDEKISWFGVHAHLDNLWIKWSEKWKSAWTIIDEDFIEALSKEYYLSLKDISEIDKYVGNIDILAFFDYCEDAIRRKITINHSTIMKLLKAIDEKSIIAEQKRIDRSFTKDYLSGKSHDIAVFKTLSFLEQLLKFIRNRPRTKDFYYFNYFNKNYSNCLIFKYFHIIEKDSKIVVLDATMKKNIVKKFFPIGAKIVYHCLPHKFTKDQKVFQLRDMGVTPRGRKKGTYGIRSYYDYNSSKYAEDNDKFTQTLKTHLIVLEKISENFKNVLIICRKSKGIKKYVMDKLIKDKKKYFDKQTKLQDKHYHFVHYGNVRGINKYSFCEAVFLLGTPFHPPDDILRNCKIMDFDRTDYEWMCTQAEMIQSVFRIIRDPKKKCHVFILSTIELFDDESIHKLTLNELSKKFDPKFISLKNNYYDEKKLAIYELLYPNNRLNLSFICKYVKGHHLMIKKVIDNMIDEQELVLEQRAPNGGRPAWTLAICEDKKEEVGILLEQKDGLTLTLKNWTGK